MKTSKFVYVIYIRTTPDKLWQALTDPKFVRKYFFGAVQESDWKPGASWQLKTPDGRVADSGEVLEIEPCRKLVLKWRHELRAELRAEGHTRMTCEIEKSGSSVKLTITHEMDRARSKFIDGVSEGWPPILSSLKSLIETGESLEETRTWPEEL
jgi:uncharacterized protein YndB with AHSA1/START domain